MHFHSKKFLPCRYGGTITNQICRLGASCDWSRERFTLDERLGRKVFSLQIMMFAFNCVCIIVAYYFSRCMLLSLLETIILMATWLHEIPLKK
jgi:hypothetical protein